MLTGGDKKGKDQDKFYKDLISESEMVNFTQSSVSKIEKRKDIKISTLIDYLDSLGMGLEIITYPKMAVSKQQEKILLKV